MALHFDVNVIEVGRDVYSSEQLLKVENMIERGQQIFSRAGLPIGTVGRFNIPLAQAGSLVVPRGEGDCLTLSNRWGVPNDALDVFVVPRMTDPRNAVGLSPEPGRCRKRQTKLLPRTPFVSLQEEALRVSGTFAHEIGHFLGLPHCPKVPSLCGPENLMSLKSSTTDFKFTRKQVELMTEHCMVKP